MTVRVHKAIEPTKGNKPAKEIWKEICTGLRPYYWMLKMDGVYCQLVYNETTDAYEAFSRTGEPMPSVAPSILESVKRRANAVQCLGAHFMGELWCHGKTHSEINGAARRHAVQPHLQFWCFDMFNPEHPQQTQRERLHAIEHMGVGGGFMRAYWAWGFAPTGFTQIDQEKLFLSLAKHAQSMTDSAYDGIIVVDAGGAFIEGDGKNGGKYKIKPRPDGDFRVVGIEGGKGKYKGMIGKLLVDLGDNKQCGVGSGLSDEDRARPPEYWLNKIVQVSYLSISSKGLLREPSFQRVRDDKTVADKLY